MHFTACPPGYNVAVLPTISTAGNSFQLRTVNMAGWGYPYSCKPDYNLIEATVRYVFSRHMF